MFELKVEKRNMKEKGRDLRARGLLPGVYYGPKQETRAISIKTGDFAKVWKDAGESSVIALATPEGAVDALIYEVAFDPVTRAPIHADFYVPEAGKTVKVAVPLEFEGVAPAVKDLGGMLVKVLHEIEVEVLPKDLPHAISVDISTLTTLESHIAIKDVKFPAGVTVGADPDEIVAMIDVAKEEQEVAPVQDLSSIEVEKKGKKDEEPAEASATAGEGGGKKEK